MLLQLNTAESRNVDVSEEKLLSEKYPQYVG